MSAGECTALLAAPPPRRAGFNEAPACLPGNGVQLPPGAVALDGASMRPRHVCRGMSDPLAAPSETS